MSKNKRKYSFLRGQRKVKSMIGMMVKDTKTTKDFSYSKGDVSLRFSLRTDNDKQLSNFLDILEVAQEEVQEELEKSNDS